MITLFDFQEAALSEISFRWRSGARAVMLVMPTGSGKTTTFCEAALRAAARGRRVLILVHRRELLKQTSRTLSDFGIDHGLIAAGMSMFRDKPVQVASVQTLVRRLSKLRWTPDLIVVDECHHAIGGNTWGKVLAHFERARVLGVTATPQRLDGKGLGVDAGGFFDALIIGPSVAELTRRGYLSPAVVYAPQQAVDLSAVKTRMGDYASGELAAAMDKPKITGDAVSHYRRLCSGEPAIAFCASVAHAEHVAESFREAGYQAASIDGSLDHARRARMIEDLGNGRLQVLTSCDIISEGTDIPVVSAAVMLRPTQSLSLALQQMGRALRVHPGKERAVILDHVGNVFRHGLPDDEREWSLTGQRKRARSKDEEALPIKQCEQCYTVHRPAPKCPACGFVYKVSAREIAQVDGELEQVDPAMIRREQKREQAQAQTLDDLVALGRQRGYKNPYGWARHIWSARQQRAAA
jgi:superfamily II DNA or RNA helicase